MGTPSHLGHLDQVAATLPSKAPAGAAQEAPELGQWGRQDLPLVRPSSCIVKGGIPSSRRYLPTYLPMRIGNEGRQGSRLCTYPLSPAHRAAGPLRRRTQPQPASQQAGHLHGRHHPGDRKAWTTCSPRVTPIILARRRNAQWSVTWTRGSPKTTDTKQLSLQIRTRWRLKDIQHIMNGTHTMADVIFDHRGWAAYPTPHHGTPQGAVPCGHPPYGTHGGLYPGQPELAALAMAPQGGPPHLACPAQARHLGDPDPPF